MKCIKVVKITPDKRLKVGAIVRVTDTYAEKLVVDGKAEYVDKAQWKASGRERI